MSTESIFSKVAELIASQNNIDQQKITLESSFEDLGMDSLDGLELINNLEETFNIRIPNEEALKIRTVQQAVESLQKLLVPQ